MAEQPLEDIPQHSRIRRTPIERAELARMIEALSAKGYSQAEIAEELNVSIGTVNRYVRPLIKRMEDETCAIIDNEFKKMLIKIDLLERRYYEGWEASQETSSGNPRFLSGMLRCINWRCEMLGLYKSRSRTKFSIC
jgi:AcrR family transcriptional regulator